MRIKEYRLKSNLTQKDIAEKLNISQSAYNHKEKGIRNFTVEELLILEIILGVSISDLYKEKKEEILRIIK